MCSFEGTKRTADLAPSSIITLTTHRHTSIPRLVRFKVLVIYYKRPCRLRGSREAIRSRWEVLRDFSHEHYNASYHIHEPQLPQLNLVIRECAFTMHFHTPHLTKSSKRKASVTSAASEDAPVEKKAPKQKKTKQPKQKKPKAKRRSKTPDDPHPQPETPVLSRSASPERAVSLLNDNAMRRKSYVSPLTLCNVTVTNTCLDQQPSPHGPNTKPKSIPLQLLAAAHA